MLPGQTRVTCQHLTGKERLFDAFYTRGRGAVIPGSYTGTKMENFRMLVLFPFCLFTVGSCLSVIERMANFAQAKQTEICVLEPKKND